jgi:hypothetical protein
MVRKNLLSSGENFLVDPPFDSLTEMNVTRINANRHYKCSIKGKKGNEHTTPLTPSFPSFQQRLSQSMEIKESVYALELF